MALFRAGAAGIIPSNANRTLASRGITTACRNPLELLPKLRNPHIKPKDEDIDPIYKDPVKLPSKHGVTSCNLSFRAYSPWTMHFYCGFIRRCAYEAGISCSGTVNLPTKLERWAVPKSPFIHKKAQEVFERRTHKRLLQLKDVHPKTLNHFIKYLHDNSPPGVGMRVDRYLHEDVDEVLKSLEKVKLDDVTPKPKILADAIIAEVAKNPSANLIELGTELYMKLFNVKKLPSLDLTKKPKAKTLKMREEMAKLKAKKEEPVTKDTKKKK